MHCGKSVHTPTRPTHQPLEPRVLLSGTMYLVNSTADVVASDFLPDGVTPQITLRGSTYPWRGRPSRWMEQNFRSPTA